jgi:hypothetical protein
MLNWKGFFDEWSQDDASEITMIPVLAAILSPRNYKLQSFPDHLKKSARKYLNKTYETLAGFQKTQTVSSPQANIQKTVPSVLFSRLRQDMDDESPEIQPSKKPKVTVSSELNQYYEILKGISHFNQVLK